MTPPSRQQWPRGPANDLHKAAYQGSVKRTIALLSMGSINIDEGDPQGYTPLMLAARKGHLRVARFLLKKGANVSIAEDDGVSALHLSARNGHLAVTVDLIQAGAGLEARGPGRVTPLHLAAEPGHSLVVIALLGAGADVDSRLEDGRTPLLMATFFGHLDAVKELLRANANPLLADSREIVSLLPLDVAAHRGHSAVVHELIQQLGIEGCGGVSGGVDALTAASVNQHVDIMAILTSAGVVDTGKALCMAASSVQEAAVKFLLQQRRRRGAMFDYVNFCDIRSGLTPLFMCVHVVYDEKGVPRLISPRVVRLLIDAGADTSSARRIAYEDTVPFHGTPLALSVNCLRKKQVGGGEAATEEQMNRLEAVRRLLLRVEAVHAISWLWVREPQLVGGAVEASSRRAAGITPASGTQLALMLAILRRRRRGALLAPLFRYSSYP